jgi:predicted nucleotidyltransferase
MAIHHFPILKDRTAEFCRRWQITEFALFGSVLTDEFGPGSDVDVLVNFSNEAGWSLLDLVAMQEELEQIIGRPVDLVEGDALRNPFRRHRILTTKRVIYSA